MPSVKTLSEKVLEALPSSGKKPLPVLESKSSFEDLELDKLLAKEDEAYDSFAQKGIQRNYFLKG